MRIAYLCNQYPAVSHTFVRREILGIEAEGAEVERVSVRAPSKELPDPSDQREAAQTFVVLKQGALALASASIAMFVRHPLRAFRALRISFGMVGTQDLRFVRGCAYFAEASLLVGRFRRSGVEHVHAHFGTNPAAVARLVYRLGGPGYSFTVHGPTEFDAPRAYDLQGKVADARAAIAISHYGRSQVMRWNRVEDWPKIHIVRCGVDSQFTDDKEAPPPADIPRLCAVGRLAPQKGFPLLIEAAALLKREGLDFELTIVGDGEIREGLEAQIRKRGLAGSVILTGRQSGAEVRRHVLQSRAFVLPSFAEGLPVAIMEALALRRPVIATAIAGISELVDGECGWLVPAGAVEPLVSAMRQALTASPEALLRMGEIGRARVLERHQAQRNAGQLLGIIERSNIARA